MACCAAIAFLFGSLFYLKSRIFNSKENGTSPLAWTLKQKADQPLP